MQWAPLRQAPRSKKKRQGLVRKKGGDVGAAAAHVGERGGVARGVLPSAMGGAPGALAVGSGGTSTPGSSSWLKLQCAPFWQRPVWKKNAHGFVRYSVSRAPLGHRCGGSRSESGGASKR